MDMAHTVDILLQDLHRVNAREGAMATVEEEVNQIRIHRIHKAVNLFLRLHYGTHMMMEGKNHALVLGNLAQLIQTLRQHIPFLVVHHIFSLENRLIQHTLDAMALL